MDKTNQEQIILEQDIELIFTTDLDGVITYVNKAMCHISGYEEGELIGQKASELNHYDMPKAAMLNLVTKIKGKRPWRGAVKKRSQDGRYFWVKEIITPIYENSSIVSYQSVCKYLDKSYQENAIKIYKEMNESSSVFCMWDNFYYRVLLYVLLTSFIFTATLFNTSFGLAYLVIPVVMYYCEHNNTSLFFESMTGNFDDVTRFIFSKPSATQDEQSTSQDMYLCDDIETENDKLFS